jgi:hypothetical protein
VGVHLLVEDHVQLLAEVGAAVGTGRGDADGGAARAVEGVSALVGGEAVEVQAQLPVLGGDGVQGEPVGLEVLAAQQVGITVPEVDSGEELLEGLRPPVRAVAVAGREVVLIEQLRLQGPLGGADAEPSVQRVRLVVHAAAVAELVVELGAVLDRERAGGPNLRELEAQGAEPGVSGGPGLAGGGLGIAQGEEVQVEGVALDGLDRGVDPVEVRVDLVDHRGARARAAALADARV